MASETEICNLALSHIGISGEIANLETERSKEASACRRFFDHARDLVLRDYPWPFATKETALALVEEDPTDEWAFSYRIPADFIRLRRVLSGIRNDTRQSRVSYRITRDATGLLLYTDQEDACLEYTFREEDTIRFPVDFTNALSFLLAHFIAPRLTAGDPFRQGQRAFQLYQLEIGKAEANSANENQPDELPDSEFIRERE